MKQKTKCSQRRGAFHLEDNMDPIAALIISLVMLVGITALKFAHIISLDTLLICVILILIYNRLML